MGLSLRLHFSTVPGDGALKTLKGFLKLRGGRLWKHLPNSSMAPGGENPEGEWEELGGRWLRVGPHRYVEEECSRRGSPSVSSCHHPEPPKIRRALLAPSRPQCLLGSAALTLMDAIPITTSDHAVLRAQL